MIYKDEDHSQYVFLFKQQLTWIPESQKRVYDSFISQNFFRVIIVLKDIYKFIVKFWWPKVKYTANLT